MLMPGSFSVFALGDLCAEVSKPNKRSLDLTRLKGLTIGSVEKALHNSLCILTNRHEITETATEAFSISGKGEQNLVGSALYESDLRLAGDRHLDCRTVVFQGDKGDSYLAIADRQKIKDIQPNLLLSANLNALVNTSSERKHSKTRSYKFVTCFTEGTKIATPDGEVPIETLKTGDVVTTRDHGPQTLRWVGQAMRLAVGSFRPIRIAAGALGKNTPERDLVVSQQHRMLIRSDIARKTVGAQEVLIPAKDLLGLPGVSYDDQCLSVTYMHLLLDRHEIVFADGAPAETLMTGPMAQLSMGPEAIREIRTLFPELMVSASYPARIIPNTPQVRALIELHEKARKPLLIEQL